MAKVKLLDPSDPRRKLDRYELIGEIATGGMATVFLARRGGVGGFQRFVAIKRLHPHLANEPEFVEMFLDEARLAALIHHPNVVPILEVGETEAGYYLVMEYVEGDTLSRIVARTMSLGQMPPRHVIVRMMLDALAGLHAAHELRDDRGQLLGLVHRDCSPQNVLIGVDGSARITDFGVARASSRLTSTAHGKLKGKLAYMAPEQTRGDELDRRTDLFAMGIILWEVLCGKRLFKADSEAATLQRILVEPIRPPSEVNPAIPKLFDAVVLKTLDRNQDRRFQNAADMADALEAAGREAAKQSVTDIGIASPREVASFVQMVLGQEIGAQRESVRAWLAQSDSGQELVFQGAGGSHRPPESPGHRQTTESLTQSRRSPGQQELNKTVTEGRGRSTDLLEAAAARVQGSSGVSQPAASELDRAVARVPHFEVAADVTMRFALEQPKQEPPPAPSSPPPPRVPPPAKVSQPTLLGQGPPVRPPPPSSRPAPPTPAAGAPAQNGASHASSQPHGEAPTAREGAPNAAQSSQQQYTPQIIDDPEDAVTIARRNNAPPPSVIQPAVKTARGLFAEPLLAEARARLGEGGQPAAEPSPVTAGARTPRMPMPADQAGVADARIQLAAGQLAAGQLAAGQLAGRPAATHPQGEGNHGVAYGAAIVEAVPIMPARTPPRTLVSATHNPAVAGGEVSAGGFTPGSMTLSADGSFGERSMRHQEALDPTVVHAIPRRNVGKYIVVIAAFLLVFGTGLMLLRSRDEPRSPTKTADSGPRDSSSTESPKKNSADAKTADAVTSTEPAQVTASSPPADSVTAIAGSAKLAVDRNRPPLGTSKPRTARPDLSEKPPKPDVTVKPTATGEDLSNPYR